eukprot:3625774-Amphidinium_carterae.1
MVFMMYALLAQGNPCKRVLQCLDTGVLVVDLKYGTATQKRSYVMPAPQQDIACNQNHDSALVVQNDACMLERIPQPHKHVPDRCLPTALMLAAMCAL